MNNAVKILCNKWHSKIITQCIKERKGIIKKGKERNYRDKGKIMKQ
jgi:hypothetical protein